MTVVGLLLAAGAGRRLGQPKALIEMAGEPLVARGVRLLHEGGCDRVVVVLGAEVERARAAVLVADPAAEVVVAHNWADGMGASLRTGLAALEAPAPGALAGRVPEPCGSTPSAHVEACVVALVDQPLVGPDAVARLLAAWRSGALAAVASYAGKQRNPVLLDRSTWVGVATLARGDSGARVWLRAHPELVVAVECGDTGDPFDIDTPADLRTLQEIP